MVNCRQCRRWTCALGAARRRVEPGRTPRSRSIVGAHAVEFSKTAKPLRKTNLCRGGPIRPYAHGRAQGRPKSIARREPPQRPAGYQPRRRAARHRASPIILARRTPSSARVRTRPRGPSISEPFSCPIPKRARSPGPPVGRSPIRPATSPAHLPPAPLHAAAGEASRRRSGHAQAHEPPLAHLQHRPVGPVDRHVVVAGGQLGLGERHAAPVDQPAGL